MEVHHFIVLLVAASNIAPSQQTINSLFDFMVKHTINNKVSQKSYTVVPIPNMVKKYEADIYITTASVSLSANRGRLRDLTSIHRVGDVVMSTTGNVYTFSTKMSMDVLDVVYNEYTLAGTVGVGVTKSGDRLEFDVGENLFDVAISISLDQNQQQCNVEFSNVTITEFKDVKLTITGFSLFNAIARIVGELFIEFFHDLVASWASDYAQKFLNHAVRNPEMCQKIYDEIYDGRGYPGGGGHNYPGGGGHNYPGGGGHYYPGGGGHNYPGGRGHDYPGGGGHNYPGGGGHYYPGGGGQYNPGGGGFVVGKYPPKGGGRGSSIYGGSGNRGPIIVMAEGAVVPRSRGGRRRWNRSVNAPPVDPL